MKPAALLAVSALALTAAACGPQTPKARAKLDCPAVQGDLTRTGMESDGQACSYVAKDGAEVTLQLVKVAGGPDATLRGIEGVLLANRQAPEPKPEGEAAPPKTGEQEAKPAPAKAAEAPKAAATAAEQAQNEAEADASEAAVHVDIKGKGSIITEKGGRTHVNLPGISVVADDNTDTARVKVGPITVDAGGDTWTFRNRRDVRLKGEALNPQKRGIRATFIYTGEDLPEGYRFVGYEAGGPKIGPLTVAIVKSKDESPHGGELQDDVRRLVRKNGGV